MASLNTLIATLTQAVDRPTLEPRFNTGEIPEQADFYSLIHSPLSRVEDGIFKTLDNPLCIRSADGDTDKNILHLYDDGTSDPVWELTIENDDLNLNNAGGDRFSFERDGHLIVRTGDLNLDSGNLNIFGSGAMIIAPQIIIGNSGATSEIIISQNAGISVNGGGIVAEDANLTFRHTNFNRIALFNESNQLRFTQIYNGSNTLVNEDRLILKDDGEVNVPGGPILNDWSQINQSSILISNFNNGVTPVTQSGMVGLQTQMGDTGTQTKYGIYSGVHADAGTLYGFYGSVEGNSAYTKYGLYSRTSGGGTGTQYGLYAYVNSALTDTNSNYGVRGYAYGGNVTRSGYFQAYYGTNTNYGIRCLAGGLSSESPTNYGLYASASGGSGTSWAGYFSSGNVYIANKLGLGRTTFGSNSQNKIAAQGKIFATGGYTTNGADYGELFESSSKKGIPLGTAVVFSRGGKIRPAKEGETPFGIVTKESAIVGNSFLEWPGKFERDEYGTLIMEEVDELVEEWDPENPDAEEPSLVKSGKKILEPIVSKKYNPKKEYIPREDRPEWCMVGLLGQLRLKKDQPIASTWVRIKKISDELDLYLVK